MNETEITAVIMALIVIATMYAIGRLAKLHDYLLQEIGLELEEGGVKRMDKITVEKVDNGYIVTDVVPGSEQATFVYQKKTSVENKVKELLANMA